MLLINGLGEWFAGRSKRCPIGPGGRMRLANLSREA